MASFGEYARWVGSMALEISCLTRPSIGENGCRERCGWWTTSGHVVMALAEGVGQGAEDAAYAAELALACIGAGLDRPFNTLFSACDSRLRTTCGVGLAVAVVDLMSGEATLASVGNVRAVLLNVIPSENSGAVRGVIGIGYDQLAPQTLMLRSGNVIALLSSGLGESLATADMSKTADICTRDLAGDLLTRWTHAYDHGALLLYRHEGAVVQHADADMYG